MADWQYDVVGIGNAIVDVLARTDDAFLNAHNMTKGAMTLIDAQTAESLYGEMLDLADFIEQSGGSAANTISGLASLGGKGAFIGKVRDDTLGDRFRDTIHYLGIDFTTPTTSDSAPTARCLVLVTPDAQRTMHTYLGACVELGPSDIDTDMIKASQVTYLEGYLFDRPAAKEAFIKAANIAHSNDAKVSLTLSDSFCVERHRGDFLKLLEGHIDILFANEDEIKALYQVDEFDEALQYVRGHCEIAALTRGKKGSVIIRGEEVHVVDAADLTSVVDTTGAGDAYAAGFLFGITHHLDLFDAARIGGIAAAEVIGHMGARPEEPLDMLVEKKLSIKI